MITGRKTKTAFFCTQCGTEHARWQGQCRGCGEWNTLVEEKISRRKGVSSRAASPEPQVLSEINIDTQGGFRAGLDEFDRVLGGRLLPGMTVLLGGEPGIGKSTLLLQVADAYSQQRLPVVYLTGEESLSQIKRRAQRLRITGDRITVVTTGSAEEAIEVLNSHTFAVAVIDSIQTLHSSQLESPPGSVGQVRE